MSPLPVPKELALSFAQTLTEELPISPAESNVVALLLYGLGDQEICKILNQTEKTTKFHLGRVYKKFGVNTRLRLAIEIMRKGFIAPLAAVPIAPIKLPSNVQSIELPIGISNV